MAKRFYRVAGHFWSWTMCPAWMHVRQNENNRLTLAFLDIWKTSLK